MMEADISTSMITILVLEDPKHPQNGALLQGESLRPFSWVQAKTSKDVTGSLIE